ncbi:3D domain-containing protein [Vibrio astriarenae]|uniref:3D domain-containing protein n=1 Tax=Vibrio astriarenae TaxID=1481923 RepID=UPI003735D019
MPFALFITILLFSYSCHVIAHQERSLKVTASAYTSTVGETDSTPNIGAWGDRLKPGMKSIAVSRDLIALGLTHNQEVRIEGFEGTYRVLDKMNKRWTRKIDIYMGNDRERAIQWGKRTVTIYWSE